ncbi:hypothetical protein AWM79_11580 [Pseudomonas agarici]|uniref:Sel1 repeat family protein n=1 Tax=Pseudomonas agarici TaxID=46677 RepID=A0A0X1T1H5_PSEAA|nr:hypothetical protein [Pseudomonas agarici]AMB85910.1 hypothetical protein AWM79_11580 [Pseudomonas agarici]NWB90676.1 sel1 repeat family protein [Pseudomonas agarici]
MKFRSSPSSLSSSNTISTEPQLFSLRVALWLLDSPSLGRHPRVKHFAGCLLKQPARKGVMLAQRRLGQLMYRDCSSARDRRIGRELLRQAACAGDPIAQAELGRGED